MSIVTDQAWKIKTPLINPQAIDEVSTTQLHPLGLIVQAEDVTLGMGEFMYVKGGTSIAAGEWVLISKDDFTTARLAADNIGPVGVAMSAIDAATDYGWVCISGAVAAMCKTSFADNGLVFCHACAGKIDDTSVAGDLVNQARGASTTTADSELAYFEINRPWVDDASNSTSTA